MKMEIFIPIILHNFFEESYQKEPTYQRKGGDLLLWNNPLDHSQIAMFASGLGDGYYTDFGESMKLEISVN